MKTPGQRQLISLQERVKVGEITVNEAVQEFKVWQFDHERRSHSIRYQQVVRWEPRHCRRSGADQFSRHWSSICNLSLFIFFVRKIWSNCETASPGVTRPERRQERSSVELFPPLEFKCLFCLFGTTYISMMDWLWLFRIVIKWLIFGWHTVENNILFCYWPTFDLFCALSDFEISAPLQKNMYWSQAMALECAVYEPSPRAVAPPPPPVAPIIQRGTWKTGSTSSTSSESKTLLLNHIFSITMAALAGNWANSTGWTCRFELSGEVAKGRDEDRIVEKQAG